MFIDVKFIVWQFLCNFTAFWIFILIEFFVFVLNLPYRFWVINYLNNRITWMSTKCSEWTLSTFYPFHRSNFEIPTEPANINCPHLNQMRFKFRKTFTRNLWIHINCVQCDCEYFNRNYSNLFNNSFGFRAINGRHEIKRGSI